MILKIVSCVVVLIEILFFKSPSFAGESEKEIGKKFSGRIQTAIETLSPNTLFVYYDLQLSEKEVRALKSLKINSTEEYNNFGNLKALEAEVKKFIKSLDNENETTAKTLSQLIVRLVKDILNGSRQETAWVTVRTFTPISEYDLPRWHTDGYYFKPYEGNPYKFAMTLKGPPTLFYKLPTDKKEEFYALQRKGTEQNEYNRKTLVTLLGNSKHFISIAAPHQGAVFIVGSDNAAVHSEPPIKEERLFVSVLPGSKKQIKEWKDKQG